MCWINLALARNENIDEAEVLLEDVENSVELSTSDAAPVLTALLSGDRDQISRAKGLSRRLLDFYRDYELDDLLKPIVLPEIVSLSVVAHIDGNDQSEFWSRIAKAKPPKSALMRSLQSIVGRFLEAPSKIDRQPEPIQGHVQNQDEWIQLVKTRATHSLFDLAATPDHPLWSSCLEYFALPLGFLYFKQLQAAGNFNVSFEELFLKGAYPWRHPSVLYERRQPKPDSLSVPDPNDPSTWFGIDAIDIFNDEVRVYHFLGFDWQAPLLFEDDVNAFRFLDTLDLSWKLVKEALPETKWKEIDTQVKAGRCVHIVVHDDEVSPAVQPDLDEAAKHYSLRLEVEDVTLA